MRDHASPRSSRRRGAALVLVMIFGVGALMLVTTMLALTDSSAKSVGEMHAQKNLTLVLKTGMATAMEEIISNTDAGGDGVGTILGGDGNPGVAVTSPTGTLLGRYRVTIDTTTFPGKQVMRVVAAHPDFTDSPRRRLAACEVEVSKGRLRGEANALSFSGETDDDNKFQAPANANHLIIRAPDGDVPAVNLSDSGLHSSFNSVIASSATILGQDKDNPDSLGSGANSVTNDEPGVLNETTLSGVRTGVVQQAAQVKNSLLTTTLATTLGSGGAGTLLPTGNYYVPGHTNISGTLTGSGTLVIEGNLTVKNGAKLDWNGTIIVIGSVSNPNSQNAEVKFESGGKLDMDHANSQSFLFVVGQDTKLTAEPGAGSQRDVTGGILLLSGPNEDAKFEFKSGGGSDGFNINGIMAAYGSKLSFTAANGYNMALNGSLAFVTQEAGNGRYTEFKKENGGTVSLTFNNTVFSDALDKLGEFLPANSDALPPSMGAYWERPAPTVLAAQNAQLGGP
ncbi:MAG: hypothetical protein M9894_03205 [Planctomycetes bacterium]|nr:hypothetical protein [Planctomycetota bacterium]